MSQPFEGNSTTQNVPGIKGTNTASGDGVFGDGVGGGRGVVGISGSHTGVEGFSNSGMAVFGSSQTGRGVVGVAKNATAVEGNSESGSGVFGSSSQGPNPGVEGHGPNVGVLGESANIGVHGKGGRLTGFFEGDVEVTGDIRLANADCAEDFDVSGAVKVEPGTVMVLGNDGALSESQQAYDKRVAGVISGAGDYKPGIVLDKQHSQPNRKPIALLGKVYCKVDASYAPIEVGDLLTTSDRPGHAMKAADPLKAFGSVIGKALRPFKEGQGLIPILIALQ